MLVLLVLLGQAADKHGVEPLARVVAYADFEGKPIEFPTAPAGAIEKVSPFAAKQAYLASLPIAHRAMFPPAPMQNAYSAGVPERQI